MADHWQLLVGNFAVVALFISAWVHGQFVVKRFPRNWRSVGFGFAMGLGAVCSMLLAVPVGGAIFDLRLSLVAVASFFGGPISGLIAAAMASGFRLWIGGPAVVVGVSGILIVAAVSLGISVLTRNRVRGLYAAMILAASLVTIMAGIAGVAQVVLDSALGSTAMPIAVLNGLAALLASFFIMRQKGVERERDLLRAAFLQAPDIQYIKRIDGKFAVVNGVLAQNSGYADPEDLAGKTDFDILKPESAAAIRADDQQIMQTSTPKIDFEEVVVEQDDDERYYLTSKIPLRDHDNEVVGIAGWTRDVTSRKRLESEVISHRNQLNYVLKEMSEGVAMFDRQGTLAYCNERYSSMFPRTRDVRRRGMHYRDILRAVIDSGEQMAPKPGREEEWIDQIANGLGTNGEEEVQLADGGWLRIKRRPTSDGSTMIVVSEITKLKEAEAVLQTMTEQLKLLATTDGLTGLTNRRAFDQALEAELGRSRRMSVPVSLLLVDVDRFKAYNDLYGHPAGDRVLKAVAQCLAQSLMRPGDIAARYGGEEFVAILPDTDEDGAYFIAENFRETLKGMKISHGGGDRGVVTASVGLATFTSRDAGLSSADLVRRADEALYDAKAAGRDRVIGWRARNDIRPSGAKRA